MRAFPRILHWSWVEDSNLIQRIHSAVCNHYTLPRIILVHLKGIEPFDIGLEDLDRPSGRWMNWCS